MMAPSDNPAVITPLTTLVSQEVLSSNNQLTAEIAEDIVKASLGFPENTSLLNNDFIENESLQLQAVAELVVVVFAETLETITESNEAVGFSVEDISEAVATSVNLNISQLVFNGEAITSKEEAKTITTTLVSGQLQNIVAATKSGDGNVVDMLDLLTSPETLILYEGEYGALDENKNGLRDEAEEIKYHDYLAVELLYFPEATEGELLNLDDELKIAMLPEEDGEWLRLFGDFDTDKFLLNNVWSASNENSGGKIENNCVTFYGSDVQLESYCFVRKDVSGFAI